MSRSINPSGRKLREFITQAEMSAGRRQVAVVHSILNRCIDDARRYISLHAGNGSIFVRVVDSVDHVEKPSKHPTLTMEFYDGAFTNGTKRRVTR